MGTDGFGIRTTCCCCHQLCAENYRDLNEKKQISQTGQLYMLLAVTGIRALLFRQKLFIILLEITTPTSALRG